MATARQPDRPKRRVGQRRGRPRTRQGLGEGKLLQGKRRQNNSAASTPDACLRRRLRPRRQPRRIGAHRSASRDVRGDDEASPPTAVYIHADSARPAQLATWRLDHAALGTENEKSTTPSSAYVTPSRRPPRP